MKTLKVTATEAKIDKNKKPYNLITFSTPDYVMQGGVKILIEPKVQRVVKYPESYLPSGEPQFGHNFKVGDIVAGDIVTKGGLLPYPIVDAQTGELLRSVDHATHVVLGNTDNEDAFEVAIWREFNSRGKYLNNAANAEAFAKFWGQPAEGIMEAKEEETIEEQVL